MILGMTVSFSRVPYFRYFATRSTAPASSRTSATRVASWAPGPRRPWRARRRPPRRCEGSCWLRPWFGPPWVEVHYPAFRHSASRTLVPIAHVTEAGLLRHHPPALLVEGEWAAIAGDDSRDCRLAE